MDLLEKLILSEEVEIFKAINQEVTFNKCEIKAIKREIKVIKSKFSGSVLIKTESKSTEAIERIKIDKSPERTNYETINMAKVVSEFKSIDIKTYLTKVPDDVLNKPMTITNPSAYNEFKLKLEA